ncbi:acyltransferase family protein [Ferrovibrio sp.]|uniref:acyltransferase family protein n=1 Tax=Ferrovibrio sp. TaxID=1917215 RepID=UPI0035B37F93
MTPVAERRFDLDWLRIIAFGLLIFYHIGMFFVTWDWHVKSRHAGPLIEPLMLLSNPWRLSLLFLIAGVATRFMADKAGPSMRALIGQRSRRLLLPLVFGMLVIVPPQTYCEIVEKLGYAGSWLDFYIAYLSFYDGWRPGGQPLLVPTWNHLWFVPYLWAYTMLVLLARTALPGGIWPAMEAGLAGWLRGWRLLLLPWLLLAGLRIWLRPIFGQSHALVDDWYLHAAYGGVFLFGFLIARQPTIWAGIRALRWPALGLGLAGYGGLLLWRFGWQPAALVPLRDAAWALQQWGLILALLGFAQIWLNHDGPARRYLTEAVFPFYILHQTVIVLVGHGLRDAGLSAPAEMAVILGATALACWLGFALVRRLPWLRPFFGLRAASPR